MSESNNFNFSLNVSASASTTNQEVGNSTSLFYDSRRNNYTSPQEHFKYTDSRKPSVDWNHEVNEVYKEEQMKQQMMVDLLSSQGGEQKK